MKTVLHTGKFLTLIREGTWEYTDRPNATGAAIIIAVTDAGNVLLVEQYRLPVHARTIEFPAGMTGDEAEHAGESHTEAACRELLEETGYEAGRIEALITGPACSGLTSELVTLFRASELKRAHRGGGGGAEAITVHEVPLPEIHEWLMARARTGVRVDPKVYAGLYFLMRTA